MRSVTVAYDICLILMIEVENVNNRITVFNIPSADCYVLANFLPIDIPKYSSNFRDSTCLPKMDWTGPRTFYIGLNFNSPRLGSVNITTPVYWNLLLTYLSLACISRGQFRDRLKTHLFTQAYTRLRLRTYVWRDRIHLTDRARKFKGSPRCRVHTLLKCCAVNGSASIQELYWICCGLAQSNSRTWTCVNLSSLVIFTLSAFIPLFYFHCYQLIT